MARAWIFQHSREKAKGRSGKWSVGWYEGRGKRSKLVGTKTAARQYAANLESRLNTDQFSGLGRITWRDYQAEYTADCLGRNRPATRQQYAATFAHVTRILAPRTLEDFTRQSVARYAMARLGEEHRGEPISPATVNKELRQIKAALREAAKRKYIAACPPIDLLHEEQKVPTYCPPEHFAKLYDACDAATRPDEQGFTAPDWWRAYLLCLYTTGWRRNEPLSVPKEALDWERGVIYLDAAAAKSRRGEVVHVPPILLEHLERIKSFGPMVFPWPHSPKALHDEFWGIQDTAGVKRRDGERYGFHDLRRGFATLNADRVSAEVLQRIMRHKSYTTTQRYIDAGRMMQSPGNLYVPELPERQDGAG